MKYMIEEIKEHFVGLCLFGLLILIMICGAFIWELDRRIKELEGKEPVKIELKINGEEVPLEKDTGEQL